MSEGRARDPRESTATLELAHSLWLQECYRARARARELPADSIFAAAIATAAADRLELVTALADLDR